MGDVIDFKRVDLLPFPNMKEINRRLYLVKMRVDLSQEDYLEFLEACLDKKFYMQSERDIRDLVDGYYKT